MMNLEQQNFQQQQQRGILPAQILNALDLLVDRLNASSGYIFGVDTLSTTGVATTTAPAPAAAVGDGTMNTSVLAAGAPISGAPLPPNNNVADAAADAPGGSAGEAPPQSIINPNSNNNNNPHLSPPIKALLVGTNEGVGLSRSLGTLLSTSSLNPSLAEVGAGDESDNFNSISEEILSTIETVWATLPSAVPPHVMASVASSSSPNNTPNTSTSTQNEDTANNNHHHDHHLTHHQPPHPLLSPLLMGSTVKTTTAVYSNCIVMHVHYPPLVVTLLMSPQVNLGAVRNILFGENSKIENEQTKDRKKGMLEVLLEPVRRALVRSRWADSPGMDIGGVGIGMMGGMGNSTINNNNDTMTIMSLQAQQQQAMTLLQQQQQHQLQSMQNINPYQQHQQQQILLQQQQQMLYQQQMMMSQQQHQR